MPWLPIGWPWPRPCTAPPSRTARHRLPKPFTAFWRPWSGAGQRHPIRRGQHWQLAPPLLNSLDGFWAPGKPWTGELAGALATLAQHSPHLHELGLTARWLHRLLPLAVRSAHDPERVVLHSAVLTLGVRTVDLPALRRFLEAISPHHPPAALEPALTSALSCLAQFEPDAQVAGWLAQASEWFVGSAPVLLERARWSQRKGEAPSEVMALVDAIAPGHSGYRRAMLWMADSLFFAGQAQDAERYYQRAGQVRSLTGSEQARMAHLQMRQSTSAQDALDAPGAEVSSDSGWQGVDTGVLSEALALVGSWLGAEPVRNSAARAALEGLAERSLAHCRTQWPNQETVPVDLVLQLARLLQQISEQRYGHLAEIEAAFPYHRGAAYGELDPALGASLHQAALHHVALMAQLATQTGSGLTRQAGLRVWLELLRWGVQALLGLEQAEEALAWVRQAQDVLGPSMGRSVLIALEERCLLAQGLLPEAQALRLTMAQEADAVLLPLREWDEWVGAALGELPGQTHHGDSAWQDQVASGRFETVTADGVLTEHVHHTAPVRLEAVRLPDLKVRLSYGLIHDQAGLLRPHAWHRTMGEFPYAHTDVLSTSARGTSLRRPSATRAVDFPVLVLANMDALEHRNYYHWMMLILPRILVAQDAGWLQGRQLLLPAELPSWMFSSLTDLGFTPAQWCTYTRDETLHLHDALVISPLEFASPTLLHLLRTRLWQAAGLDIDRPPRADKRVFISRRSENRRPLMNETAVMAHAESLGFEVVAPETLPLLDQVRLFASASAVAGPPGAAFTNLAWAQAGTRVVALYKPDVHLPTFVDISVIREQKHRWLLGKPVPGFERASLVNAPYTVNIAQAHDALRWACGH
ncbi:MAG: hypothetical protein C4K60_12490 [Ideonella sp. MAG2]|nr:MAG: hypothetical protein C4K60_12490 [Ideonella sp. MAG2]